MHVIRTNQGKAGGGNVVIGRVVHVHVKDGLVDERFRIDPAKLAAVARMGGISYALTRQRIEVPLGREALGKRPAGLD
jgi:flavin reductase (DIM6/NTAB) family NADH-FMN oxidoreductase RutF